MTERITTGSYFTNSYIISNDKKECVVIDPGLGYEKAARAIKERYQVRAIIITHSHMDHIDGIRFFKDIPNLPVYISKKDERGLYDPAFSLYYMNHEKTPYQKNDLNITLVSDNDIINIVGYDFKFIMTPGHTVGSMCIACKDELFSGDTLFNGSCGRMDFPGGSEEDMDASLTKIMDLFPDEMIVYPGHGEATTIGIERENNPYIK